MRIPNIALDTADREAIRNWSRWTLAACSLVIGALIVSPMLQHAPNPSYGARAQENPSEPSCARWDELAGEAIVRQVQHMGELDLRQFADAISLMRRARRNCSAGWLHFACLDYARIVGTASNVADTSGPDVNFHCDRYRLEQTDARTAGIAKLP